MSPATITTPAASIALAAPVDDDRPAYRYVGSGTFEPANAAAWREVTAWNEYATMITARSAASRSAAL